MEAIDHARVVPLRIHNAQADIVEAQGDAGDIEDFRFEHRLAASQGAGTIDAALGAHHLFNERGIVEVEPIGQLLVAAQAGEIDPVGQVFHGDAEVADRPFIAVIDQVIDDPVALIAVARCIAPIDRRAGLLRAAAGRLAARGGDTQDDVIENLGPGLEVNNLCRFRVISLEALEAGRGRIGLRRGCADQEDRDENTG